MAKVCFPEIGFWVQGETLHSVHLLRKMHPIKNGAMLHETKLSVV
jgi:hypothetical protein